MRNSRLIRGLLAVIAVGALTIGASACGGGGGGGQKEKEKETVKIKERETFIKATITETVK